MFHDFSKTYRVVLEAKSGKSIHGQFFPLAHTFWNKPLACGVTLIRKRGKHADAVLKFGLGTGILRALWEPRGR